jgi:hypothetical protein
MILEWFCIANVAAQGIDRLMPGLVCRLEGRGLPVSKTREKSRGHAPMKSRFLLTRAGDSCFLGFDSKGAGQQEQ